MKIVTNGHERLLLNYDQLSAKEQADFDWTGAADADYIRYKGNVICVSEFMRSGDVFPGWDGYSSDSFFSGLLVRYVEDDNDRVIMGWYMT